MVRTRARAPTCPLATLLSFCPVSRFAPPFPTVRTSLLLSDDVCRRCNHACDRLFTLVVKFLHAPFWRPCTLAPGDICTPLPPYSTPLGFIALHSRVSGSSNANPFCCMFRFPYQYLFILVFKCIFNAFSEREYKLN